MDLRRQISDLFDRLGADTMPPRYPGAAVEIAPDRVTYIVRSTTTGLNVNAPPPMGMLHAI